MSGTYYTPKAAVEAVKKESVTIVYETKQNAGAFLAEALKDK